mmetsp:Transcript_39256/g.98939  ORF Transcript_39256/g.98939 Transcript_39256/m.98939 type:complete len:239 (-) Transcript_39256:423-1139(-)
MKNVTADALDTLVQKFDEVLELQEQLDEPTTKKKSRSDRKQDGALSPLVTPQRKGAVRHQSQVTARLEALLLFLANTEPFCGMAWSEIFYHRMRRTKNVLSPGKFKFLETILREYTSQADKARGSKNSPAPPAAPHTAYSKPLSACKAKSPRQQLPRSLAQLAVDFIDHHQMDPDSSLIGLRPKNIILQRFNSVADTLAQMTAYLSEGTRKPLFLDDTGCWADGARGAPMRAANPAFP